MTTNYVRAGQQDRDGRVFDGTEQRPGTVLECEEHDNTERTSDRAILRPRPPPLPESNR